MNMLEKHAVVCFCMMFLLSAGCGVERGGVYVGEPAPPPVVKKGGPPPWAPAHGYRAKYAYRYYPDSYVYFDVSRGVYFYLEGGEWRAGASLPGNIHVEVGDYVTLEMDTSRPYVHHREHRAKYPPGRLKKNRGWGKDKRK